MASVSKSRMSVKSKKSQASKKSEPGNELFDKWRPPPGIKYTMSQTNVDFDATVPRMTLKYTTLDIEPGQDLTVKPSSTKTKYQRRKSRAPVFQFTDELEAAQWKIKNEAYKRIMMERIRRVKLQNRKAKKAMHESLIHQIGPAWFHELSHLQMEAADTLKAEMAIDMRFNTISRTQDVLSKLGIVLWPNHTKIQYALKKYHECPVEFLLKLYQLNRPKEPEKQHDYTLNDRIMLSAVVHLAIRDVFRELHLRLPSPKNKKVPPKPFKIKRRKKKYPKWNKSMSPYLEPIIPLEQKHRHGVYKNRHKEYPSLRYFNYKDDMYLVHIVDDVNNVRTISKSVKRNKWTRPPKIPVRVIQSKVKKKKIYELKKPSNYISPCDLKLTKEEDIVIEANNDLDNICTCNPKTFTKDTSFDLKIKITTSKEEVYLTQKLSPYKETDNIGNLNFVEQKMICECMQEETEEKHIKKIEYSCECCICGKSVNISQNDTFDLLNNEEEFEGLPTIEEYCEEEEEPSDIICPCVTPSTSTLNSSDTFALCTCKSSSDSCTCCTCGNLDKDFILRVKRFNQANNTCYSPCVCKCNCKKHKKRRSLCQGPPPVKYCFCKETRRKEEVFGEMDIPEDQPEETEVTEERKKTVKIEDGESLKSKEEFTCECVNLYTQYLNAHESCMSLFKNYQQKIEDDIKDYMKELSIGRCTCGDSLSHLEEEEDEDEQEGTIDAPTCTCVCCDDTFAGCTCNDGPACTCGCDVNTSSESTSNSTSSSNKPCTCSCTCGPCECKEFVDQVKENIAEKEKCECDLGKEEEPVLAIEEEEEGEGFEEDDPRIYHLDEFPTNRHEQMELLKKVLDDLAAEKYPLATLPEVHRLPHFQVWLDMRSGKYVSMEDRETLMKISKIWWIHTDICHRKCIIPEEKYNSKERSVLTWGKVFSHKKYLLELRTDFFRRLKQANIAQAQEFFPTMFHYKIPNKTFRNVFFSYFPSDENHCQVFRTWKEHEMKNMSTRKPCL